MYNACTYAGLQAEQQINKSFIEAEILQLTFEKQKKIYNPTQLYNATLRFPLEMWATSRISWANSQQTQHYFQLISNTFGHLRKTVFQHQDFKPSANFVIYQAAVIPAVLHDLTYWPSIADTTCHWRDYTMLCKTFQI